MPRPENFPYILAKISAAVIVAVLFLTAGGIVYAQENSGVFAKHRLELKLAENLTAQATYDVEITNNNESPLNQFTIQVPFSDVHSFHFLIDGQEQHVELTPVTGGTTFTAQFTAAAILMHQTKSLSFTFDTGPVAQSEFGLTQLYVGKVSADHIISDFKLTVDYPHSLPPLRYTSSQNLATAADQIQLEGINGFLMQWSDGIKAAIQEEAPVDLSQGQESILFNLLHDHYYQKVDYLKLQNLNMAATDVSGNLWGIAEQMNSKDKISYTLNLDSSAQPTNATGDFPQIDYGAANLKQAEELAGVASGTTIRSQLQTIFEYMVHSFSAAGDSKQNLDPRQIVSIVNKGDHALTDLEFAYVTSAYCQQAGLKCNTVYGYLIGGSFAGVDTHKPHAWVEAVSDDGLLVILDPYLQIVTGFDYFAAPTVGRLVMGVLDPAVTQDSALGMTNVSPRLRPPFNPVAPVIAPGSVSVETIFPASAKGGEFYSGTISVNNQTAEFIQVRSLKFDAKDITVPALQLTPKLQRLFVPFSVTKLTLDWQREPNFLIDATKTLHTEIVPVDDTIPVLTADSQVIFLPNTGALFALLMVIVIIAVSLFAVGLKLYLQQAALERKRQAKLQPPRSKLAKLDEKPKVQKRQVNLAPRKVHKLEDR